MKLAKYLFALTLFLQVSSLNAQKSLTGFLDIHFGTKIETAKQMLLQRPGVKFIRETKEKNVIPNDDRFYMQFLYFKGVKIGEFQVDTCMLVTDLFRSNIFSVGSLHFNNYSEKLFNDLYGILEIKYGYPDKTTSEEGYIKHVWYFLPFKTETERNNISLQRVSQGRYRRIQLDYDGVGTIETNFKNPIIEDFYKKNKDF